MLPATLFIPYGKEFIWQELRYALRSWSIYSEIERVIVIGERPDWFTGEHIPWQKLYPKTEDIWRKTLTACEHSEKFIFANDDHILTRKLTTLPYYHTGSITKFKGGSDTFMRYVSRTADLLGPGALYYDIHTPMIIEAEKFRQLTYTPDTLLKSVYCNTNKVAGEFCLDPIIKDHIRTEDIKDDLGMIAFNNNGLSNDLRKWLKEKFPEKSRWEK